MNDSSSVSGNTAIANGGGILNIGRMTMNDSSSVSGNTADGDNDRAGAGGGIWSGSEDFPHYFTVTLKGSSSVTGNVAAGGGGVSMNSTINACDNTGVDEWTGAISPNSPDDPPPVNLITCA